MTPWSFSLRTVRLSDGALLAEGETTHIVTDAQMKMAVLPDKYLNAFARLRKYGTEAKGG